MFSVVSQKIRPTGRLFSALRFETCAFNLLTPLCFDHGVGETAGFKETDILTCQGYVHVIDKVLFYDDADGSDGARATTIGIAAGAVALGAALL